MFVLVVGMAYRYLFVLLGSVIDMYQARKSRTVGAEKHDEGGRRFVAAHRRRPAGKVDGAVRGGSPGDADPAATAAMSTSWNNPAWGGPMLASRSSWPGSGRLC